MIHKDFLSKGQITEHFNIKEFRCRGQFCCDGSSAINFGLVFRLEYLREALGVPLVITSGFRCEKHNRECGGSPGSYHRIGLAADIQKPEKFTVELMWSIARDLDALTVIKYEWGIHCDMRGYYGIEVGQRIITGSGMNYRTGKE